MNAIIGETRNQGPAEQRFAQTSTNALDDVDMMDVGRRLWRRKWLILAVALVGTVGTAFLLNRMTPQYQAHSLVMISGQNSNILNLEAVVAGLPNDVQTIETQTEVLRSRQLVEKVVLDLNLDQQPEFNPALREPSTFARNLATARSYVLSLLPSFTDEAQAQDMAPNAAQPNVAQNVTGATPPVTEPPVDDLRPGNAVLEEARARRGEMNRVVDIFLDRLSIKQRGESQVIALSFQSASPVTAAAAANKLADLYIVEQLEAKFEATQRATSWLNERIENLRRRVENSERAVAEYRQVNGLLVSNTGTPLVSQELSDLNSELTIANIRRAEAESRLRQVQEIVRRGGQESYSEVLSSALITSLRQQQSGLQRQLADLSGELGAQHPRMRSLRAEIADLNRGIRGEVAKVIQGLENEVNVARARQETLQRNLNELKGEVAQANEASVVLRSLEREAQSNRMLLETMLARFQETNQLDEPDMQQPDARVISYAEAPEEPSSPKYNLLLAMAFVGFTSIGGLSALALEQMDRTYRSGEQLEKDTGLPVLGLVPLVRGFIRLGRKPENQVLEKPNSLFTEALRGVYTSLLLQPGQSLPKTLMITSARPMEGKTSLSITLTRLLAMSGRRVLIVDCDLRKPKVGERFGLEPDAPGVIDVIDGKVPLTDAMHKDEASGAYVLPAGRIRPSAPDLFGGELIANLLKSISGSFDQIIIDSAPILAVSDPRLLSRQVDGAIMVVRWGDTPRNLAKLAIKQFINAGGTFSGVVLSMVDVKKNRTYGYEDSGQYADKTMSYYRS
ncbi:MAG: hypothetical protein VR70_03630 [Rhodospirillaceae bacterium BRH_c57]|nr:MAG: hypothetical protein VR70_03630 [Rhodospirillaceae bacterium BRH_c57]